MKLQPKTKVFLIATLIIVILDLLFISIASNYTDKLTPIYDTAIAILVFWIFSSVLYLFNTK